MILVHYSNESFFVDSVENTRKIRHDDRIYKFTKPLTNEELGIFFNQLIDIKVKRLGIPTEEL